MRLIDADLMIDGLRQEIVELALNRINGTPAYTSDLKSMIDRLEDEGQAPTVDAVEVVRCSECKHKGWIQEPCHGKSIDYCRQLERPVDKQFFCGLGERKGGDE